jgi:hypothetical protein
VDKEVAKNLRRAFRKEARNPFNRAVTIIAVAGAVPLAAVCFFVPNLTSLDIYKNVAYHLIHPSALAGNIRAGIAANSLVRSWVPWDYAGGVAEPVPLGGGTVWGWLRGLMAFDTVYGCIALWVAFALSLWLFLRIHLKENSEHTRIAPPLFALALAFLGLLLPALRGVGGDVAGRVFAYAQLTDMAFAFLVVWLLFCVDEHIKAKMDVETPYGLRHAATSIICLGVLIIPPIVF